MCIKDRKEHPVIRPMGPMKKAKKDCALHRLSLASQSVSEMASETN